MKTRLAISIALLAAVFFALTFPGSAQRQRGPMVTSLSASIEKDGPHPDNAEIKGPAPIMCISTITDDPKSPKPACKITAPGFSGILREGEKANATDAGTVTLSCTRTGWVRCRARIN
jgi:hypothetical protein